MEAWGKTFEKEKFADELAKTGWSLILFETGARKDERYRATKPIANGEKSVSANSQELLLHRCASWDASQASLKTAQAINVHVGAETLVAPSEPPPAPVAVSNGDELVAA